MIEIREDRDRVAEIEESEKNQQKISEVVLTIVDPHLNVALLRKNVHLNAIDVPKQIIITREKTERGLFHEIGIIKNIHAKDQQASQNLLFRRKFLEQKALLQH